MDLTGKMIGKYSVKSRHKWGGVASVYRAYDAELDRDVAIKLIQIDNFPPDLKPEILERFFKEAKVLAKLVHPNIIDVIEYGTYTDIPYIVMPFIDGPSLTEKIKNGPMPWYDAFKIIQPLTKALAYAQSEGVIHRDLKTSNILFTPSDEPILIDFGIAKVLEENLTGLHTKTGLGLGTPEYTAPEQWVGRSTKASDQYSIGVVLYQMVTGSLPFPADTPDEMYLAMTSKPAPLPSKIAADLPIEAEEIILTLTQKDPKKRYPDFAVVEAKITKLLDDHLHDRLPSKTLPSVLINNPGFRTFRRSFREHTLPILVSTGAIILLAAFTLWRISQPQPIAFVEPTQAPPTALPSNTPEPTPTFTPEPTPTQVPVVIFEDNFDDGNLDGWNVVNGNWHVEDGALVASYLCDNCDGQHRIYANLPDLTNFELTYDIKRISGWDTGSLLLRDTGEDFFQFDVHPSEGYQGGVVLSKSPTYGVAQNTDLTIYPGEWYHVRVRAVDNVLEFFMVYDGEEVSVLHYDDLNDPYLVGDIGFMIWSGADANASVAYDNVILSSIP